MNPSYRHSYTMNIYRNSSVVYMGCSNIVTISSVMDHGHGGHKHRDVTNR